MQTHTIIRPTPSPEDPPHYDAQLGFSIGGIVRSVESAVKSVASTGARAVTSSANAVGRGVSVAARTVASAGVKVVSTVARASCGTVQVANKATPIAASIPNPYAQAGAALTAVSAGICNMVYSRPSATPAPAPELNPYPEIVAYPEVTTLNVGPTALEPAPSDAGRPSPPITIYPRGTIYYADPRSPGRYRVAVPRDGLSAGETLPTHVEIESTTTPPPGATEVTAQQFNTQTAQETGLRGARLWGIIGGAIVVGGGATIAAVHYKRKKRNS